MTNQEAKQKAIQEAYGEYYDDVKPFLDKDGWVNSKEMLGGAGNSIISTKLKGIKLICLNSYHERYCYVFKPKSLSEIDSNNGWTRIEPDGSNLPTDETKKYIAGKLENGVFKQCTSPLELCELSEYHTSMQVTHYRPVEEITNPIY